MHAQGNSTFSGFPEQSGYYSWAELRLLSTSLGLPCSLLVDCIPSEIVNRDPLISTKVLLRLLDMGYFTAPLHFTFCMKSGIYNIKVIAKCLDLLDSRSLSFNAIREANVAFSAYEHMDQKGMKTDRHTLTRCLKMCGMAVSPKQLSAYLTQRMNSRAEAGRIQLYEFLELLVLCEPRDMIPPRDGRVSSTAKTPRDVYELDDMRSLLATPDEKLALQLNQRIQQHERWMFPRENDKLLRTPILHKENMRKYLKEAWRSSHQADAVSPHASYDKSPEKWTLVTPVPHLTCRCYTPKQITPILSEEELEATRREKDNLQYEIETLAERSAWQLNWKMDYYIPGYRERTAARPKSGVEQSFLID
ncbi:hypothetical protein NDU88_004341 [Pleurodeles waltl]|uniref:Uncharacterized protein n=1 Tax=Pleurodeles waltl TaxID=8319 RepID=A0AAV7UG78_PLEWA|nr:hypothetical protein NDU88_004341 [Pleurodeles waltl]